MLTKAAAAMSAILPQWKNVHEAYSSLQPAYPTLSLEFSELIESFDWHSSQECAD